MDTVHTAITEPVRRLEVFTGAGRRRKWSDEDKVRIVAEIVASGDSVCSVARRHGLSPQQLFGWRRQCEKQQAVIPKLTKYSLCRRWWTQWYRRQVLTGSAKRCARQIAGSSRLKWTASRSEPVVERTRR
nr:transposase [Bradyrhizobium sp. 166]